MFLYLPDLCMYREMGRLIMDNPITLYFISAIAMVVYFLFCIATTWFFAKLVLRAMPGGNNNDSNKATPERDEVSERGAG